MTRFSIPHFSLTFQVIFPDLFQFSLTDKNPACCIMQRCYGLFAESTSTTKTGFHASVCTLLTGLRQDYLHLI